MSALVAIQKQNVICLASDSCVANNHLVTVPMADSERKLIRFKDVAMGVSGPSSTKYAIKMFMRSHPEKCLFGNEDEIFATWQELSNFLINECFMNTNVVDYEIEALQFDTLIATPSGIFAAMGCRDVVKIEKFFAIGTGDRIALGAMHAMYDLSPLSAEEIAVAAIEIATKHVSNVCIPVQVFTIPN